jgi:hypothetical protein
MNKGLTEWLKKQSACLASKTLSSTLEYCTLSLPKKLKSGWYRYTSMPVKVKSSVLSTSLYPQCP